MKIKLSWIHLRPFISKYSCSLDHYQILNNYKCPWKHQLLFYKILVGLFLYCEKSNANFAGCFYCQTSLFTCLNFPLPYKTSWLMNVIVMFKWRQSFTAKLFNFNRFSHDFVVTSIKLSKIRSMLPLSNSRILCSHTINLNDCNIAIFFSNTFFHVLNWLIISPMQVDDLSGYRWNNSLDVFNYIIYTIGHYKWVLKWNCWRHKCLLSETKPNGNVVKLSNNSFVKSKLKLFLSVSVYTTC